MQQLFPMDVEIGECCVSGCSDIRVNDAEKVVVIGDQVIREGDWLSLNWSTGEVILGKHPLAPPALSGDLEIFMSWADQFRLLKFFATDERMKAVRKMIMAVTFEQRQAALDLLFPYQKSDFEGIFRAMDGLPVTIRLFDPPLHEFLLEGHLDKIVSELALETGMSEDEVYTRIEKLSEVNPMLGFRGCRLGISYPELTEIEERAIFLAAVSMSNQGFTVIP